MTQAQTYAQEIQKQLYWTKVNGIPIAWSWGIPRNSYVCGDGMLDLALENAPNFERNTRAWLRFNVSGRIHKGLVYVILTGSDDYTILLVKMKRRKVAPAAPYVGASVFVTYAELVSETEGIYCDELASVVDRLVETPEKKAAEQEG